MDVAPPVLVLQNLPGDGPAYLRRWLDANGQPSHVALAGDGGGFPSDMAGYRALAVLGGAMSANDPLPALRQAERLILQSFDRGLPVIGHCLGGQLMARALGAIVAASPAPEIGWQRIDVARQPAALDWFGDADSDGDEGHADGLMAFQWHYEAFALPAGAASLAGNKACPVQAFAFGPHLAMQFHVELDAAKLERWLADDDAAYRATPRSATVHAPERIRVDTTRWLAAQQRLADRIYTRWLSRAPTF